MTPDSHRLATVNAILAEPFRFLACNGCGSFLKKRPAPASQVYVCPVCNGYSFFDDEERIREHARKLALSKPTSIQREEMI